MSLLKNWAIIYHSSCSIITLFPHTKKLWRIQISVWLYLNVKWPRVHFKSFSLTRFYQDWGHHLWRQKPDQIKAATVSIVINISSKTGFTQTALLKTTFSLNFWKALNENAVSHEAVYMPQCPLLSCTVPPLHSKKNPTSKFEVFSSVSNIS